MTGDATNADDAPDTDADEGHTDDTDGLLRGDPKYLVWAALVLLAFPVAAFGLRALRSTLALFPFVMGLLVLWLLHRLVVAADRVADAQERIARERERVGDAGGIGSGDRDRDTDA